METVDAARVLLVPGAMCVSIRLLTGATGALTVSRPETELLRLSRRMSASCGRQISSTACGGEMRTHEVCRDATVRYPERHPIAERPSLKLHILCLRSCCSWPCESDEAS